ncbi:MAG TPA: putative Ig domain-containing protein [Verrucomicrobiae bacterium]|nr:putative Ig domain-containing protein [Verrucomicrobiae bacterium]
MKRKRLAKSIAIHGFGSCLAFLAACGLPAVASGQTQTVRIVTYNIDADQGEDGAAFTLPQPGLIAPSVGGSVTNGGVLEGIGEEVVNGDPAQPIDILALQETTSNTTTVQPIVDGLNTFYAVHGPAAGYAMSPYQATESNGDPTFGNGPNALVYNTNTVQLLASVPVDPPGGTNQLGSVSGEYREVMRYEFAPAGVTPTTNNEFYIYVSHYKASAGITNETHRLGEAEIIRNDEAANLPATARVIYLGDYNPDNNSGEPAYQTILSNSAPDTVQQGQGVDPLNTSGATNIDWSDTTTDTNILFMLTEESYELRFRDDLQVMTSNVYYDVAGGLQYVPGTYHSFGNNATIPWASSVTNGSNTALSGIPTNAYISAAQCYTDLTTATDHLPVVADYIIVIPPPPPVASFTASPTNGVAPLNVSFTDTSSGLITGWAWAFGDGHTSTSQNPTNVYLNPGSYTVQEIASGPTGVSTNVQPDYIVVNCPTITLSPSNLPDAIVASSYNQTISASNGFAAYAYATTSGTLPTGLSLSSNGVLSGTPTVAGTYAFTVTATDTKECTGSQAYSVTITCPTLTLKATSVILTAKGGSKDVSVKVKGTDCSWMAASNDPFITITSGSSGTGNGKVDYTVSGNTNVIGRIGTMTIAGQTFTVNQGAGGCTFSLSPKHGKFKAVGGTGTVKVKPNFGDCAWTVVKNPAFSFITITDGASGVGEGTVSYTVAPNSDTEPRAGSFTIGGKLFIITQAGAK